MNNFWGKQDAKNKEFKPRTERPPELDRKQRQSEKGNKRSGGLFGKK